MPQAGDDSLLQRLDKHPDSPLEKAMVRTLCRGKHDVRGFKGEEILEVIPTDGGIKRQSFTWEAVGAVKSVFAPRLRLDFETATPLSGQPRRSTLTDEQAMKLYDRIVNSIRLRPTGDRAR